MQPGTRCAHHTLRPGWVWPCTLLGWLLLGASAHAASLYRCVGAHGETAYRDTPCPATAHQHKVAVDPQPLIGAPGEHAARIAATPPKRATPRRRRSHRVRASKPQMWWECRADDGEVFYRHARCPSSVPGDGTVRAAYMEPPADGRRHRIKTAWDRVRVHGVKVPKTEACHRIHAVAASSRDGYRRDDTVSVYDRLMGRDPCGNA